MEHRVGRGHDSAAKAPLSGELLSEAKLRGVTLQSRPAPRQLPSREALKIVLDKKENLC